MIKWKDIAERADAIAEEAIGQLSGREKCGEEVAGKDDREEGRERDGEEVAREKALVERLQDSDYVYAAIEARKRYDYRRAFERLRRMGRRSRRLWTLWSAAGAAASILVAVGIYLFPREEVKTEEPMVVAQLEPARKVKAVLVTADGGELSLDERGFSGKEGGITLVADSVGLQYEAEAVMEKKDTLIYNTLIVPRGGVYHLTLTDGTEVWLNSDSRLRYPVNFTGDTREVFLTGEAYLNVTRNEEQPFIVTTDAGSVRVLGTEFNVKYYPEEENVAATLVTGSISFSNETVKDERLTPGHQLVFETLSGKVSVRKVNVTHYVSWREDKMAFHNEPLGDIMRILSRWFDVEVMYRDEYLKELLYTGNLDKYDDIETFLHLFELGGSAAFDTWDNMVVVRQKTAEEMKKRNK